MTVVINTIQGRLSLPNTDMSDDMIVSVNDAILQYLEAHNIDSTKVELSNIFIVCDFSTPPWFSDKVIY